MGLNLFSILALSVLAVFFALMFFTKEDKNKIYIQHILLAFPLIGQDLLPSFMTVTSFDFMTIVFLFGFYKPKREERLKGGYGYMVVIIILALVTIGGLVNAESLTRDTATAVLQFFCFFTFAKIMIEECIADNSFFYTVIKCLKITLGVSLIFLLCQFIFGVGFSISKSQNINVLGGITTRYTSFFQDPQKFAQFLAASSFLFLIKDEEGNKLPFKNYMMLGLALVAILFTGGRAGLGGWGVGLMLIIAFGKSSYRFAAITACLLLYLVMVNFQDSLPIFKRASLSDSYDFRFAIWEDAFRIFQDHPFFGIGLGNYANYVSVHNPDQFWIMDNEITYFNHPESGYLKFLTEFGALGFCAVYYFVFAPIFSAFMEFFKSRDSNIMLLIAAVTSWIVGFYTVYSFDDARIRVLIISCLCLLVTSYKRTTIPENAE